MNKYCTQTVEGIYNSYMDMNKQINTEPTNEKELVMTREFIKDTPNKVEKLSLELHEVYKHYLLMEDY